MKCSFEEVRDTLWDHHYKFHLLINEHLLGLFHLLLFVPNDVVLIGNPFWVPTLVYIRVKVMLTCDVYSGQTISCMWLG